MANESTWAGTFGRVTAALPVAVETAENLGALLAPGVKSGGSKLTAVKAAVAAVAGVAGLAGPAAGAAGATADVVLTALINAVVAWKKLHEAGAAPTAAPPAPVAAGAAVGATGGAVAPAPGV